MSLYGIIPSGEERNNDDPVIDPLNPLKENHEYSIIAAPYRFGYHLAAREFLEKVNTSIRKNGFISVADVRKMRKDTVKPGEIHKGWTSVISENNLRQGYARKIGSYYWVKFPDPIKLKN